MIITDRERFRSREGFSAEIAYEYGRYVLTMRDKRGRIYRRRTHRRREDADEEMSRHSRAWRVA